ncbi:hypothetical protein CDAR_392081 [Caerostris darwini]|uniref:Neurotransmitter-gated ion-channel ligand-binding domain-containing protein n=1 Tax=Caerostris darwini TaxID=1538125 RepID=A0AAV4S0Z5_9ARAC|nr:hypothetical protein CDAR_392081 [Caerostris darwini]
MKAMKLHAVSILTDLLVHSPFNSSGSKWKQHINYGQDKLTVTNSCPMDLRYFPMDRQQCTVEVESSDFAMSHYWIELLLVFDIWRLQT